MRIIHSTALLLALVVAAAAPARAQNVTPQQAQALLQARPDLAAQVRQRVGSSGLTQAQIQTRLREQGYDPSLLDPYMGAAAGEAVAPGNDVLAAMRALGIADDADLGIAPRAATVPVAPDDGRAKAAPTGRAESERIFGLDLFRNPSSQFLPTVD